MPTPFGPQLIGETEKSLNALLRRFLGGTGLTEPQWVTLRMAQTLGSDSDHAGLIEALAARAQFVDAADLVNQLTGRGLLLDGAPTPAGLELVASVQARVTTEAAPVWEGHAASDVEAATRLLTEVTHRALAVLRQDAQEMR